MVYIYILVGGLEHEFYFSISYMGCHPNPIDELIFFKMGRSTTNQMTNRYRIGISRNMKYESFSVIIKGI